MFAIVEADRFSPRCFIRLEVLVCYDTAAALHFFNDEVCCAASIEAIRPIIFDAVEG